MPISVALIDNLVVDAQRSQRSRPEAASVESLEMVDDVQEVSGSHSLVVRRGTHSSR